MQPAEFRIPTFQKQPQSLRTSCRSSANYTAWLRDWSFSSDRSELRPPGRLTGGIFRRAGGPAPPESAHPRPTRMLPKTCAQKSPGRLHELFQAAVASANHTGYGQIVRRADIPGAKLLQIKRASAAIATSRNPKCGMQIPIARRLCLPRAQTSAVGMNSHASCTPCN